MVLGTAFRNSIGRPRPWMTAVVMQCIFSACVYIPIPDRSARDVAARQNGIEWRCCMSFFGFFCRDFEQAWSKKSAGMLGAERLTSKELTFEVLYSSVSTTTKRPLCSARLRAFLKRSDTPGSFPCLPEKNLAASRQIPQITELQHELCAQNFRQNLPLSRRSAPSWYSTDEHFGFPTSPRTVVSRPLCVTLGLFNMPECCELRTRYVYATRTLKLGVYELGTV